MDAKQRIKTLSTSMGLELGRDAIWALGELVEEISAEKVRRYHQLRSKSPNDEEKTLNNTNIEQVKKQVSDVEVYGNGDLFELISKASSKNQSWMKSTKAMEVEGEPGGVVLQVSTQNKDQVAEAVTFIPGGRITRDSQGNKYIKI